ncbi:hypothetical protein BJ741DRAFT_75107 [Chytriomyces cf. hyalinus JEL632]|nr:hypothetical protein BJ741DRAFT_75107 [Chytriomyces cf. hyalinus JEL632]
MMPPNRFSLSLVALYCRPFLIIGVYKHIQNVSLRIPFVSGGREHDGTSIIHGPLDFFVLLWRACCGVALSNTYRIRKHLTLRLCIAIFRIIVDLISIAYLLAWWGETCNLPTSLK